MTIETTGLELLVGAVLPFVMEFVIKYVKSTNGKFAVSLLIPLIAGVVLNANRLAVSNIDQILASGAVVFASAQTVYKLYFKDSELQRKINS